MYYDNERRNGVCPHCGKPFDKFPEKRERCDICRIINWHEVIRCCLGCDVHRDDKKDGHTPVCCITRRHPRFF